MDVLETTAMEESNHPTTQTSQSSALTTPLPPNTDTTSTGPPAAPPAPPTAPTRPTLPFALPPQGYHWSADFQERRLRRNAASRRYRARRRAREIAAVQAALSRFHQPPAPTPTTVALCRTYQQREASIEAKIARFEARIDNLRARGEMDDEDEERIVRWRDRVEDLREEKEMFEGEREFLGEGGV